MVLGPFSVTAVHFGTYGFTSKCCRPAGSPLELVQPDTLRWKVMEPILLLGKQRFEAVDIRIRVKGGGHVSQIYGVHTLPASACKAGASGFWIKIAAERSAC